jgi:hypothetical protein
MIPCGTEYPVTTYPGATKDCPFTGGTAETKKDKDTYVWAVPCNQEGAVSELDSGWGGPHVTLGKAQGNKVEEDFNKLLDWTREEKYFYQTADKEWNPTNADPEFGKEQKCGTISGYHVSLKKPQNESTLDYIQTHMFKHYKDSFVAPETGPHKFHVTVVTAKQQTHSKIRDLLGHNHWTLALVQIQKTTDGQTKIRRLNQGTIHHRKSANAIPEPTTLLLALLALVAAPLRVRCG